MKYVVLYQSKTGNTEKIAQEIYGNLPEWDTGMFDIDQGEEVPSAELYFIGFGVHKGTCGMEIIDEIEKLAGGKIALFATCGNPPTEQYKKQIESAVEVWMPDEVSYLGMFLCQGSVAKEVQQGMLKRMGDGQNAEAARRLFQEAESHPDDRDLAAAGAFAREMAAKL